MSYRSALCQVHMLQANDNDDNEVFCPVLNLKDPSLYYIIRFVQCFQCLLKPTRPIQNCLYQRKSVAAGRVAATFVATRLAGIFPFPDILRSEAKSGPVRSQQLLLKRRTSGFSTSGFHFRCFFSPKLFYPLP